MSYFAWGPKSEWDKHKSHNGPAQPMEIPKGYKSMRLDVETSLEQVWVGEKKFLGDYHVKLKTAKEKRGENLLGLVFNPDVPKDNHR